MPSSRGEYPSSLYPEVGSSYRSTGYGSEDHADGYSARRDRYRDTDRYEDRYRDDNPPRDKYHRHDDKTSDSRDVSRTNRDKDTYRPQSKPNNNRSRDREHSNSNSNSNRRNSTSSSARIWERILPPDFRPSQADPDERHRRRSKEKECEGFDWTPGVVLGLLGAAALFNHERSLVRRRKKEYIER